MTHSTRCIFMASVLSLGLLLTSSISALAATQERISKYGSIEEELKRLYHPIYAGLELERFKAGGMAWARDLEFFGLITLNFYGKHTAALLDQRDLETFLISTVTRNFPDTPHVDIFAPDVREEDVDYGVMGYVDVDVWLVEDGARTAYYIDFNACKEELEQGQGGRWYEYALGMAEKKEVLRIVKDTLTSMTEAFAADFTFVRNAPPVKGYMDAYEYPGLDENGSTPGTQSTEKTAAGTMNATMEKTGNHSSAK